jgi:hypothetical protein
MSDRELMALEREAQRSPGDVATLVRLGQLYERARRLRDAFVCYSRARDAAPDDATVQEHWTRLGGGQESTHCARLVSELRDQVERAHAASMLGVCGGELARAALRHALAKDESFQVRRTAAASIAELGAEELAGDLVSALDDRSAWVRARAADALCHLFEQRGGYRTLSTAPRALDPLVARWKAWWTERR